MMALRGAILLRNLSEINYKPPRGLLFSRSFSRTNVHSEEVCSINSNVDRKHYDVIIAGGGLVGAAMACAIATNPKLSDKRILMLDGAPKFKGFQGQEYSNRVFAISKGSADLMERVGAWDKIKTMRYKNVKQMQVWDALSNSLITFDHDFQDDVSFIIESDVILESFIQIATEQQQIEIQYNSRIEECILPVGTSSKSIVKEKNGMEYSCNLLIGADGANSIVRKAMEVDNYTLSYNQMGIVATLELSEAGDNCVAWQRFLPDGVIAILPLTENLSSLVWSTNTDKAKQLLALNDTAFVDAINEAYAYKRDEILENVTHILETLTKNESQTVRQLPPGIKKVVEKSRAGFPLGLGMASSYVQTGVALIGDAAHRVHPLAGQGLNLGFGDVKCLSEELARGVYDGFDLGNLHLLLHYEKIRLQHNIPVILGVHALQRLYSTDFSPLVLLRSVGLQLANSIDPIKKFFMAKARS